jgi:hypothetical protein
MARSGDRGDLLAAGLGPGPVREQFASETSEDATWVAAARDGDRLAPQGSERDHWLKFAEVPLCSILSQHLLDRRHLMTELRFADARLALANGHRRFLGDGWFAGLLRENLASKMAISSGQSVAHRSDSVATRRVSRRLD